MNRSIVWFSCGAASAVVAKLAPPDARIVYCDTMASEDVGNQAFFDAVQNWVGRPIETIGSAKFVHIDDVFESTRYMSGVKGARCTVEMKKIPRFAFQLPDDTHMFGLTADEGGRIARFESNNPELTLRWILRDSGITKADCYKIIKGAGIELPAMYAKGFKNNNCKACVKATSPAYWDLTRQHFPEDFVRRARQSRALGVRLCRYKSVRIFLDELPPEVEDPTPQEDIECGPVCLDESNTNA